MRSRRIILFNNRGEYETALELLRTREQLAENVDLDDDDVARQRAWHQASRAFAAEGLGDYPDALQLYKDALEYTESGLWVKQGYGRALRMVGDRDESRAVFEEILAELDEGARSSEDLADALFALGRGSEALEACERWRVTSGLALDEVALEAGMAHILAGELETGRRLVEGWIDRKPDHDGRRSLLYSVRVVEEEAGGETARDAIRALGAALVDRLVETLERHEPDPGPDAELARALETRTGAHVTVGLVAGLARRARERDDWEGAASWYQRLSESDAFPELTLAWTAVTGGLERRALEQLAESGTEAAVATLEATIDAGRQAGFPAERLAAIHQTLGDALVRRGESASARARYEAAADLAEAASVRADLRSRAAIACDLDGAPDPDRRRLASVLQGYLEAGVSRPGQALGALAGSLIGGLQAYATLDATWARAGADQVLADDVRAAVREARDELVGALDDLLEMSGEGVDRFPAVSSLVLELGDALVPIVDNRVDGGHFLFELVPAMQERIRLHCGVRVPGVRARGAPMLGPTEFVVQVEEVSVLKASLDPSDGFTVTPGRCEGAELTDFGPGTGEAGVWSIERDAGPAPDLTAADRLIHHLESAIRGHLPHYLGPQEVDDLIATWREDDPELVDGVLPEPSHLPLTWLLQSLTDDGVPFADWRPVLTAIRDAGGIETPPRTLCRALRLRLANRLPGPSTGWTPVMLPSEYEAALLDDRAFIRRLELRRWLRELAATSRPPIVLVADADEARESLSVIAHVADVGRFVERLHALTRAGGTATVMTLNKSSLLYLLARAGKRLGVSLAFDRLYSRHHLHHFTRGSLRRLLEGHGFRVEADMTHNAPLAAIDIPVTGPLADLVLRSGMFVVCQTGAAIGRAYLQTVTCRKIGVTG